ncbi:MAG: protein-L-isoaspartate(D-aspartate) O-methyltransferase [Flavobacteriaceae bacterium]|nr:protein-L-isoaspartate(D-aspartate) O-methyltransferase [Flavobacteriaceae bacterium]
MKDTFKHQGLRKQLISLLKDKGILDFKVLEAMNRVPRHLFLDSSFEAHSYQNKAFPIGADQTISHPFTVAFQTELLRLKENHVVLEIGTGCGYQTAVLLEMRVKVYSIERQQELFKKTKLFLPKLGYRAKQLIFGDGYKGLPEYAPYDSIVVTAGAPYVPKPLLAQLKIGGRLVIPIGNDPQIMHLYVRTSATEFKKETFGEFRFVPMLEDKN